MDSMAYTCTVQIIHKYVVSYYVVDWYVQYVHYQSSRSKDSSMQRCEINNHVMFKYKLSTF